ncbi:hypothetical protein [Clostridium sp. C8-1-8]|uniref:hypothetical protein n=1 Tax=Clostridium sp. C8-1-8 TaxID=2698831 RepID=UPI0013717C36|nr:hypothetical protein [Clostridium sp. C8-1-8]
MNRKDIEEMELDLDFELGSELTEEEEIGIVGGKTLAKHTYSDYCVPGGYCG